MTKNFENDFFKSNTWKEYEKMMTEKEKYIKKGPNVIHLEYLGKMLTDKDINDYEIKLKDVGLELSRFDKSEVMYASLDKYSLIAYILLAQPIIGEFIKDMTSNVLLTMLGLSFIADELPFQITVIVILIIINILFLYIRLRKKKSTEF